MATLKDFFAQSVFFGEFIDKNGINEFIETGTGKGDTVDFVLKSAFIDQIYSIEIIPSIAVNASIRFKDKPHTKIINADSVTGLEQILNNRKTSILYFLDAHFPGADFGLAKYSDEKDENRRIPLQKEIETIVKLRGKAIKNDHFIIDDLRVYEDGPYAEGNWPWRKELGGEGIDFIYDALGDTHYIEKDYRYQGFIIITPIQ